MKGRSGGAAAWMALEPPGHPWPIIPGQSASPGPFFLVWQHPERSGVGSEQWPYALMSVVAAESPAHRWPQLEVDPHLPPDAPARRGQAVFVTQCLPCHRMQGGGASEMGPDLGRPMNATAYLTEPGLRALIRDPKSVRTWPLQQMRDSTRRCCPTPISTLSSPICEPRRSPRPRDQVIEGVLVDPRLRGSPRWSPTRLAPRWSPPRDRSCRPRLSRNAPAPGMARRLAKNGLRRRGLKRCACGPSRRETPSGACGQ